MCWWKIFQPCVPHCLDSWKYTSTSLIFLVFLKPKSLNSRWSEGTLKPIGWGESISANRQPGKNNVPIDAGVIQFVFVGTSCHNVTDSQCDYEVLGVYSVYIVCITVELLCITSPFFVSGGPGLLSRTLVPNVFPMADARFSWLQRTVQAVLPVEAGDVPRWTHSAVKIVSSSQRV